MALRVLVAVGVVRLFVVVVSAGTCLLDRSHKPNNERVC